MSKSPLCTAITASGQRCRGTALDSSGYCYAHSPDRAAQRRENAAAGGRSRSRRRPSEVALIKRRIDEATDAVLQGRLDRASAAVAFQGFNVLLRALEVERRILETEEFAARLSELEDRAEQQWGA